MNITPSGMAKSPRKKKKKRGSTKMPTSDRRRDEVLPVDDVLGRIHVIDGADDPADDLEVALEIDDVVITIVVQAEGEDGEIEITNVNAIVRAIK